MGKLILFAGLILASVILNQLYQDELTIDKVASMVIIEQEYDLRQLIIEEEKKVYFDEDPDRKSLKVLAFGDMMLGRYVRTLMNRNGMEYVFEGLDWSEMIDGYDVVHANLEGPIKGEGRSGGTSMVFAFNRDIGQFLKNHGFTVVSTANNHALDAGWAGRNETMEVLRESDVGFCGHPSEAAPDMVYFSEENGVTFAFACFQDITFKINKEEVVDLLQKIDTEVDYVFVSVHWGSEYGHSAGRRQVELGHAFVDAGADFVIGHHPHVVQEFEIYNGVPIFYSLGNFIFDQYWAKKVQEELAIGLNFSENRLQIELIPMISERSQSRLMTEKERMEWFERFIKYGKYDEAMKEMIRSGVIYL